MMVFVQLNSTGAQRACQASGEEHTMALFSQLEGEEKPKWSEFIHNIPPDGSFIPNNHTFVCFGISRRFVLSVLRFSAAASDAETVFLRWQTTLAALNL